MKLKLFLGTFLILLLMVGSASAYSLPLNTDPGLSYNNILHDTSGEYIASGDAIVDMGDVLTGDIIIDRINTDKIGKGTGYDDLTAHFAIEVTGKNKAGWVTVVDPNDINNTITVMSYTYTFSAVTGSTDGAVAWYYTDASGDATLADASTISDGVDWVSFGFTDSDTTWTAWTVTDDIALLAALVTIDPGQGNKYGYFNFALDVITNNTNLTFNDVGISKTQLTGQGHFTPRSPDMSTDYAIGDQADMYINVVPEPTTFVLFGVSLLGLAGIVRRKRN